MRVLALGEKKRQTNTGRKRQRHLTKNNMIQQYAQLILQVVSRRASGSVTDRLSCRKYGVGSTATIGCISIMFVLWFVREEPVFSPLGSCSLVVLGVFALLLI